VTPLKPIENLRVRGVAAERYPLNEKCAHPECAEPTEAHHCFPRSQIKSDSWFVEIAHMSNGDDILFVIPHVAGLCREHHNAVESHDAWIKLEDGRFEWYDRLEGHYDEDNNPIVRWARVGQLNPQPGSREGKPKRKRLKGEARRKRRVISIRVPDDTENGGELWDEMLEQVKEKLVANEYENAEELAVYETVMAGLYGYVIS
jgi:hypothetical protein